MAELVIRSHGDYGISGMQYLRVKAPEKRLFPAPAFILCLTDLGRKQMAPMMRYCHNVTLQRKFATQPRSQCLPSLNRSIAREDYAAPTAE
jgi:hypothetical protein